MRRLSHILYIILPLLTAAAVTSCGTSRNTATTVKKTTIGNTGGDAVSKDQSIAISSGLAPQSQALLKEARKWLGTPYKYGGTDKNGIDCSGLVMNVYRSALAINMPRNSKAQSDYCTPTPKKDLIPGDLLFFATSGGKKVSHVGIFIGDNRMIHSSASKGVIISDINARYYTRTFAGSGRVEQYHAMISSSGGKKETPRSSAPQKTQSITLDDFVSQNPTKTVSTTPTVNTAPKTVSTPKTASKISVVNPADSTITKELSTDEARASVLNSIIEQKLDSIYNQ